MNKIVILEVKVGLYPGVFKFADKGTVSDTRLQPFRHNLAKMTPRERALVKDEDVIRVDKLYAPEAFFAAGRMVFDRHVNLIHDKIRLTYGTPDKYAHFLNSWLAIINHYGLDADYDPDFIHLVDELVLPLVMQFAYRKEDDETNPVAHPADGTRTFGQIFAEVDDGRKRRYFHNGVYLNADFSIHFDHFLKKYNR